MTMTDMTKLILSLAFAFASVAAQPGTAEARIATNAVDAKGVDSNVGGAADARGLEIREIRLPRATVEFVTKE
jgi:hypothetical protein